MKVLRSFLMIWLSFFGPLSGQEIEESIQMLGHADYQVREQAMHRLVIQASDDFAGTVQQLLARHDEPEIQARAAVVMERIYLLIECGKGAPSHGLKIKSAFATIDGKLSACPMIDGVEAGSPASDCALEKGDIVIQVDELSLTDEDATADLLRFLSLSKPGAKITLRYSRKKGKKRLMRETHLILGQSGPFADLSEKDAVGFKKWLKQQNLLIEDE